MTTPGNTNAPAANNSRGNNAPETGAGATGGSSLKQKVRGVGEVIHGVGDNIRGTFMDALEPSAIGAGHTAKENGRAEAERGMARITGSDYGPGAGTVAGTAPTGPQPGRGAGGSAGAGNSAGGYSAADPARTRQQGSTEVAGREGRDAQTGPENPSSDQTRNGDIQDTAQQGDNPLQGSAGRGAEST